MAREWLQGSLGGGPSCCVLFWMARSGEFLEDFDVRSREERIPTGVEVAFSQLEVTAEEDFGLAWGSQGGDDVENLRKLARFRRFGERGWVAGAISDDTLRISQGERTR